jgi:hypothetical protein
VSKPSTMRLTVIGPNCRSPNLHAPKDHPTKKFIRISVTASVQLVHKSSTDAKNWPLDSLDGDLVLINAKISSGVCEYQSFGL